MTTRGADASRYATDLAAGVRSVPLLGRTVSCPLCTWSFRHFTSGGTSIRRKSAGYCPRCNSKPRHRWLWMQRSRIFEANDPSRSTLLHVAPAHSTARAFRQLPLAGYVPVDLTPSKRTVAVVDIERPGLRREAFDIIICVHVLEHVNDDGAAMRALRELVRPTGTVVIGVPLRRAATTREDPNITDPAARERNFGEPDHRRWYGDDITSRLAANGLIAESLHTRDAPDEVRRKFGLTVDEGLFLCRRTSD